jgi:hypothetical protein
VLGVVSACRQRMVAASSRTVHQETVVGNIATHERRKSNHMSVNACEEGGGHDWECAIGCLLRLGAAFLVSL